MAREALPTWAGRCSPGIINARNGGWVPRAREVMQIVTWLPWLAFCGGSYRQKTENWDCSWVKVKMEVYSLASSANGYSPDFHTKVGIVVG